MARREQDVAVETDPHDLLFGSDDVVAGGSGGSTPAASRGIGSHTPGRGTHRHRRAARPRRGGRGVVAVMLVAFVAIAAGVGWWVVRPILNDHQSAKDYSGAGTGSVLVTIDPGADATAIGQTLHAQGVVASVQAFVNAAGHNANSKLIQPGAYQMHRHMAAAQALNLLLNPAARVDVSLQIPEGATSFQISALLAGRLHLKQSDVQHQIDNVADLNLPATYQGPSGQPVSSSEGFLFPNTYLVGPTTAVNDVINQMITTFIATDRSTGFAAKAKALNVTPYQLLTIASIVQSEAKFPDDMAKVSRVILNRIAAHKDLQIDATTRYGAAVNGVQNPSTVSYDSYPTPYNSYLHAGLPPTPISNPGKTAMVAAAAPPAGNWLYYVNSDAQGDLFFTNDPNAFAKAAATCRAHHWGCG